VAHVRPRAVHTVGHHFSVVAQVRALGGADVALTEDQRGTEVTLDHPLERGEEVRRDQVVGIQ